MSEDTEKIEATLEVCSDGVFRARLLGCDKRTWCGMTSRSAKVRLVRAVTSERGRRAYVHWSYRLPAGIGAELADFRQWAKGRERREVVAERLRLAEQLIRVYRLTVAEAAFNLGITPGTLGLSLRATVGG